MNVAEYVRDVAGRAPDPENVLEMASEYSAGAEGPEIRLYDIDGEEDGTISFTDTAREQYKEDQETGSVKIRDVDTDQGVVMAEYRPESTSPMEAAGEAYGLVKRLNRGYVFPKDGGEQRQNGGDDGSSGVVKKIAPHVIGDAIYEKVKKTA